MVKDDANLFAAFRHDHALLGRGFHDLSASLRAGDAAGARAAAERLDEEAGAHIAFEESDFYPVLGSLLGADDERRLRDEHRDGLEAVRTALGLDPRAEAEIPRDLRDRALARSERMEGHIAECGELFGTMGRIAPEQQARLYRRLLEWRRRKPRWTAFAARDRPS